MKEKSALIAMSGGVDSSAAACLMKEKGYECVGVTMKLFANEDVGEPKEKACCSLSDVEDARSVTTRIDIPYYVVNFSENFDKQVIEPFVRAYLEGRTPNPCIDCNRFLKFKRLYERGQELDLNYIVTGHYVRLSYDEDRRRYVLRRAADRHKDQSYVLYFLTQEQLAHSKFPLGDLTKEQVRAIAEKYGLRTAHKQESQDICFVRSGSYAEFIEAYTGQSALPGDIVTKDGRKVGRHKGLIRYTVGQRRGLGVAYSEPLFVCAKDLTANRLIVCTKEQLKIKRVTVGDINWVALASPDKPFCCQVKLRYSAEPQEAEIVYDKESNSAVIEFASAQNGAACGQAAVFYEDDLVLGGGTIIGAE
ncbi:tRNA 2-thiouridine(34) synthase MnmA [bacterium]|nr:tRNA 2-thiouridine(34) synthase MnmA [bacterium]